MHRRWKSLRDCYARELKKQKTTKSGAAASVRKRYIYFEHLRFLEPVHCATESNVEMQEGEQESHGVEDDQVADSAGVPQYPKQSRSKKRRNQEDLLLEVLQAKIASKSNTTKPTEDADSMFLSSLLPELKKIPENHKLFVKSQIVNTILGVQTTLNIASIPVPSRPPYHHNVPNTQFYPQHLNPNYEIPSTSNNNQSSNPLINRNFYQPTSTFTHAPYQTLEPAVQTNFGQPEPQPESRFYLLQHLKNPNKTSTIPTSPQKNITPIICKTSPSILTATTPTVETNSPFSTESNVTEMSNESDDFPFWKRQN